MPRQYTPSWHARYLSMVVAGVACLVAGCATAPAPSGVNYPGQTPGAGPSSAATVPGNGRTTPARNWMPTGAGADAQFERSSLLADTFYKNPDALLQQVEKTGAMGINRGWEAAARKGAEWYIEEQRFADTIIGAGVNRNRTDLIDAGIRALEWGFSQQAGDGSFPCRDNFLSASYFVAATSHAIWLLQSSGASRGFESRLGALMAPLGRAAQWLASNASSQIASPQYDGFVSRYFLTGYALGQSGRLLGAAELSDIGEQFVLQGMQRQLPSGVFPEKGGFDASFQSEGLVYLLRYVDHVATDASRAAATRAASTGMAWLNSRVSPQGVVATASNTRTAAGKERDRTGQPRRISAVAVSRSFGLAHFVLREPKYEKSARLIATVRQPN